MSPSERLRAHLAEPGFVVMPAIWDGLSAKLAAQAGFKTAFMSGSCVAGARLGELPDPVLPTVQAEVSLPPSLCPSCPGRKAGATCGAIGGRAVSSAVERLVYTERAGTQAAMSCGPCP